MDWLISAILYIPITLEKIMTTLVQLTDTLVAVEKQLEKAQSEILNKIEALNAALTNVVLPPEAEAALANLKREAEALDNIVPDATPEVTPVVEVVATPVAIPEVTPVVEVVATPVATPEVTPVVEAILPAGGKVVTPNGGGNWGG